VLIEREHDIVRSDGVGRGEEAEHRLKGLAFVCREHVLALPLLDIALAWRFLSGASDWHFLPYRPSQAK